VCKKHLIKEASDHTSRLKASTIDAAFAEKHEDKKGSWHQAWDARKAGYATAYSVTWRNGWDLALPVATSSGYPYRITFTESHHGRKTGSKKRRGRPILLQQCVNTKFEESHMICRDAWERSRAEVSSSDCTPTICGLLEDGISLIERGSFSRVPASLEEEFQRHLNALGFLECGFIGKLNSKGRVCSKKWAASQLRLAEPDELKAYFFRRDPSGWDIGAPEDGPGAMLVFRSAQEEEERRVVCFFADVDLSRTSRSVGSEFDPRMGESGGSSRPSHGSCVPRQPDRA
jgi:hypothetical protein